MPASSSAAAETADLDAARPAKNRRGQASTANTATTPATIHTSFRPGFGGSAAGVDQRRLVGTRREAVAARRAAVRCKVTSASASLSASTISCIDWKRSAGVFSSACMTMSSTSSGTAARTTWRLGTFSIEWRAMIAMAFGPVNGGWPMSSSYSTQPRL